MLSDRRQYLWQYQLAMKPSQNGTARAHWSNQIASAFPGSFLVHTHFRPFSKIQASTAVVPVSDFFGKYLFSVDIFI